MKIARFSIGRIELTSRRSTQRGYATACPPLSKGGLITLLANLGSFHTLQDLALQVV